MSDYLRRKYTLEHFKETHLGVRINRGEGLWRSASGDELRYYQQLKREAASGKIAPASSKPITNTPPSPSASPTPKSAASSSATSTPISKPAKIKNPYLSRLPRETKTAKGRLGKQVLGDRIKTNWGNKTRAQYKPLTARGGANPQYNVSDGYLVTKKIGNNQWKSARIKNAKYGTQVEKGKARDGMSGVIKGERWDQHFRMIMHNIITQGEIFRMTALEMAQGVFQNSFKYQRFYTSQSTKWTPLASHTTKKRLDKKPPTGTSILHEYGDLLASIKVDKDGLNKRVYTARIPDNEAHGKKNGFIYAGLHNFGYSKKIPQRQFMGHSSYLDPMVDTTMSRYLKAYMFDSVFTYAVT